MSTPHYDAGSSGQEMHDECVCVGPEGLGVREEGVQPRDEGCTPDVRSGPAVRKKLWGSSEREWSWMEEGEEISKEEPAVRRHLDQDLAMAWQNMCLFDVPEMSGEVSKER